MILGSAEGHRGGGAEMTLTWVGIAGAVVLGIGFGVWLLGRRGRVNPLSRLVLGALGTEWAERTGADVEAVRAAALRGEPTEVRTQLAALVDDVEVGFEFNGASEVHTSIRCQYLDGTSATTATLDVAWEDVPQEVRADFLRTGEKTHSRRWSLS
jgi:hypothetical protein